MERREDFLELRRRNAWPVVAHADPHFGSREVLSRRDVDARPWRPARIERIERIADQVDDDPPELLGIRANGAAVVQLSRHVDVALRDPLAKRIERRLDDLTDADVAHRDFFVARVAQEMRDRTLHAVELFERDARVLDVLRGRRILAHLRDQAPRRRDRIANLVRDRRRELFERTSVAHVDLTLLCGHARAHARLDLRRCPPLAQDRRQHSEEAVRRQAYPPRQHHDHRDEEPRGEEQQHSSARIDDRMAQEPNLAIRHAVRAPIRLRIEGDHANVGRCVLHVGLRQW